MPASGGIGEMPVDLEASDLEASEREQVVDVGTGPPRVRRQPGTDRST